MQRLCEGKRLCPAFDTKFAEDVIDVLLDCADADDELVGDVLIEVPGGDQAYHFQFAFAERVNQRPIGNLSRRRLSGGLALLQQQPGDGFGVQALSVFPRSPERLRAKLDF